MSKISALVITYNELPHINALIKNLEFADEIIVIDSYSGDGTFEKLKSFKNVTTYQYPFSSFPRQKNIALNKASFEWVVFIDADERLSTGSIAEIERIINNTSTNIVAYYAKFKYYFGDKLIRFSGFQSAKSIRLFKRTLCKYDENRPVHERLIVNGKTGILSNKIKHYSFRNYKHYKDKMTQYAILKAQRLYSNGQTVNSLIKQIKIVYRFFNHYIMRLGILDGKIGYQISLLNAYEVKKRYDELDRLNKLTLSEK